MNIETSRAIVAALQSDRGADMLEINELLRISPGDGVMTRESLFAFCIHENLWLKIKDHPVDGARYFALNIRGIMRLLNAGPR